tara:strand:- start:476 stop:709 length:234 start_codon:yes stop_codon:yes gene_type:complete
MAEAQAEPDAATAAGDTSKAAAACDIVLERLARNIEHDEDEQQGAHKLEEEAACGFTAVRARVRDKVCTCGCDVAWM